MTPLSTSKPSLSIGRKLAYGVGDVGPALVATLQGFFLNAFLLDVAGLPPQWAAAIFLIVKIWDSVNDPLIGWLSDHTHTRWGRRRAPHGWRSISAGPRPTGRSARPGGR